MKMIYHNSRVRFLATLVVVGFFSLVIPQVTASNSTQIPEQAAFGIEPTMPLPDPESRQYITKTISSNEPPLYFNAEVDKTTQSVVLSGHVLVFEEGHENGLWESYHNNKTLKDLEVHADTVIIRGSLRLPQTNLSIYARDLRFEDDTETASINTTPYSLDIVAQSQTVGQAGNPGGNIILHISNISLDNPTAERFFLNGAQGQEGGQGSAGSNASKTKIFTGTISRVSGFFEKSKTYSSSENVMYVFWPNEPGRLLFTDESWGDSSERPRRGGDAIAPGISGHGGQAGSLIAPQLTSWLNITSLQGGAGGTAAAFVSGGSAGKPSTAYHEECSWEDDCKRTKTYSASSGKSYSGTAGNTGDEGQYIELDTEFSWLTPPLFSQSLRYTKDMYLYGYYDDVETYLNAIIDIVNAYQDSAEWSQLDDLSVAELNQLLEESQGLQQRLHAGLDYFGKPLGWVPGLSFEVNQSVYNNEIDTAIDVLWLTHSMQQNINSKQARKSFAQQMVTTLNAEVEDFKDQYQQANSTITNLEPRINQLNTDTENLKQDLDQRAEDLRQTAEEAAVLNGIRDSLLVLTEHVPLANVATRVVFEIPNIDPDKPLLNELFNITKDSAWDAASESMDNAQELSDCVAESGDPEQCAIAKGVRDGQEKSELAKQQGQLAIDLIRGNSASNDAVNAELQRILAEDPRWLALTQEMTNLHERKADLVADLMTAIDTVNRTSSAIRKNLLAVDIFHQDVINATDILDPRVIAYTKDMAQRARHRLEQYQYYMVRSYEYRMLRPYPATLDLNSTFDDFCRLQAANDDNDLEAVISDGCNAEQVTLSENDFKNLGVIYKEQISTITEDIINDYNTGGGVSQDTAVEFDMPIVYLNIISQNLDGAKLNLVDDLNLFNSSEEDIRIRSIEVIDLEFNSLNNLNYVDISFIHTGVSFIRRSGETYLFQHYLNSETRPIQWITRYNGNGSLQGLQTDSNSSKSLIGAIIGNSSENLKIFASPAAWADLYVKRSASPDSSTDSVSISRMRVRVNYEYTPTVNSIKTLRVAAESITKAPPIDVLILDLQGRSAGQGDFVRSFASHDLVTLKAPLSYGQLQFQRWEENGSLISTDPQIEVIMDRNKTVLPVYISLVQDESPLMELPVVSLNGSSSTRIYAAALKNTDNPAQQFGLSEPFDIQAELHVGAENQGDEADIYVVAIYNGNSFMKDSNQNWLFWDGELNSLVANATLQLGAVNPVMIVEDLSGLPGDFSIFVGHDSNDGNIHYNSSPLNFTVQ